MTISGIIAEFNPFHSGHRYLLQKAQGLKIVAMSGNYVQRGEPAIIDKWVRAQMALENGADLVVELPFLVAVQSADYFAQGAIAILDRLKIDTLVFGTEELINYQHIATIYSKKQKEMTSFLNQMSQYLTYPQKMQLMWQEFAGLCFSEMTPNHILGLSYAKACSQKNIMLQPVKRQGAGYHCKEQNVSFASATSLRLHRDDNLFLEKFIPNITLFQNSPHVDWADYFDMLKYHILIHPNLTDIFQVNDELASRIISVIRKVTSIEELIEKVSTKRYTKSRVRRVLNYILINAVEDNLPEAIHVLGFSKKGQEHLKTLKQSVPFVTRIGSVAWDVTTQRADQIYQLGNSNILEQTWGRTPIRLF